VTPTLVKPLQTKVDKYSIRAFSGRQNVCNKTVQLLSYKTENYQHLFNTVRLRDGHET